MLDLLHIENVAVIECADVEFGPGLNVLTGETGAGKSIILDAIGAILGGRISRELVRSGAAAAQISAELSISEQTAQWLTEAGIDFDPAEGLLLYRRITAEGKSQCRINGVPVAATQLRELGELLFDLHGQNDGRRLLSEAQHRRYLDSFAGLDGQREVYAASFAAYQRCCRERDQVRQGEADQEYREERLKREIRELSEAQLQPGEVEALNEQAVRLRNLEKLRDKLTRAFDCLQGGDEGEGAISLLVSAENAAEAAARISGSLQELAKNIGDLRYRVEDAADQIEMELRELEDSPGKLERVEDRLNLLKRLERRYGTVEAAITRLEAAQNELEDVEYLGERLEKLEAEAERLHQEALTLAGALSRARGEAALRLSAAVERELRELSMPGARFEAELRPKGGEGLDAGGMDEVRFLLSANAGELPGRLSHIASGGELSRILLALKNVLRSASDAEVLIFDEIDTGVSGIAAQRVGEKLASLAAERQVLCVTHLPQLAAMADAQFSIEKRQEAQRTYTQVKRLDSRGRKEELARLIGGETVTEATLRGAGELIAAANQYKRSLRKTEKDETI